MPINYCNQKLHTDRLDNSDLLHNFCNEGENTLTPTECEPHMIKKWDGHRFQKSQE